MILVQAGVHEEVVALDIGKHEAEQEVLMGLGESEALATGLFAIEIAVAREGSITPVQQEGITPEIRVVRPTQEIEEHRLVVAEQEDAFIVVL